MFYAVCLAARLGFLASFLEKIFQLLLASNCIYKHDIFQWMNQFQSLLLMRFVMKLIFCNELQRSVNICEELFSLSLEDLIIIEE